MAIAYYVVKKGGAIPGFFLIKSYKTKKVLEKDPSTLTISLTPVRAVMDAIEILQNRQAVINRQIWELVSMIETETEPKKRNRG